MYLQAFKRNFDEAHGYDSVLSKLDHVDLAYAFIGAQEAVDAMRWRTISGLEEHEIHVATLLGPPPPADIVGPHGVNCFSNALKQFQGRRRLMAKLAAQRGNGRLGELLAKGLGDPALACQAIVNAMLAEWGFNVIINCIEASSGGKTFTIELPSCVVTFSATLYLSQLVARQLDLTSMKKGDKIAAPYAAHKLVAPLASLSRQPDRQACIRSVRHRGRDRHRCHHPFVASGSRQS